MAYATDVPKVSRTTFFALVLKHAKTDGLLTLRILTHETLQNFHCPKNSPAKASWFNPK